MSRGARNLLREFFHPDRGLLDRYMRTQKRIHIDSEIRRRQEARNKFSKFIKFVKPDFYISPFHCKIIKEIEAMFTGDYFLTLSCPPRWGKSELCSRLLPAFLLGINPFYNIVLASYSQQLANKNMRDVLRVMSSPEYKILFPRSIIPTKMDRNFIARQDFTELINPDDSFKKSGSIKGVGVGSSLTGFGAHYLICDDLHKDRNEADSDAFRNKVIEWYQNVARTRLDDINSKVILVGTRFHPNDIIGTCLQNKTGDKWQEIKLPAIADKDYPDLHVKTDESLWADKFPIDELNKTKESIGLQEFNCLYLQNPVAIGNLAFNFIPQYTDLMLPRDMRQACVISIDPALGNSKNSDYSSITIAMRCPRTKKIYIDSYHERCKVDELIQRICALAMQHKPDAITIEKNNFQSLLLNPLNDALLRSGIYTRLLGINNTVKKETRILRLAQFLPNILFYKSSMNEILVNNIKMYPQIQFDDPADSCEMAIRALIEVVNSSAAYA